MSNSEYLIIKDIQYNKQDIYYKSIKEIKKASIFNDDYYYYYKEKENEEIKYLGKYIGMGKLNLGLYYNDVDYDIYKFENQNIFTNKLMFIYSQEISLSSTIPDLKMNLEQRVF